jgi:hypothetical protein
MVRNDANHIGASMEHATQLPRLTTQSADQYHWWVSTLVLTSAKHLELAATHRVRRRGVAARELF